MRRKPIFCVAQHCAARNQHRPTCVDADCQGCLPRMAQKPSHLCRPHERRLKEDIISLPRLYQDLSNALIPPDMGMQHKVSGGGIKNNAFPFNDAAAQLRQQVQRNLTHLASALARQRKLNPPDLSHAHTSEHGIIVLSRYLSAHIGYITSTPTLARRASNTLSRLASQSHRTAFPSGTRTIDIGQCPEFMRIPVSPLPSFIDPSLEPGRQYIKDDDWLWEIAQCLGTVQAKLRTTDNLLPSEVVCSRFPKVHAWSTRQWLRLRKQLQQQPASAT